MKSSGKAQIAMEYMLVMGLVLLVAIPLIYYAMQESNISVQLNKANDAVLTLSRAADTVYSIGPGTRKYVWIDMPGGVEAYSLINKTVLIKMYVFGGLSDIFSQSKAELAGSIPLSKGQHRIIVKMTESGYVMFGEANDTTAPVVIWTDPSGTINYNGIVLRATTNEYASCKYDGENVGYAAMSDMAGSGLTHEEDLGILDNGNYDYFVLCQDPSGNLMQTPAVINFTIVPALDGNASTNETPEPYPPSIYLLSPENGYIANSSNVLFKYNVTDDSSIWRCDLMINSTIKQTDFEVTKNITQNFTTALDYGNYTWNINCTDVHGNENSSLRRNISINQTLDNNPPAVSLVEPADNITRKYWLTRFSYIANDAEREVAYCDLHMLGVISSDSSVGWTIRDSPVAEGVTESVTLPLFKANYTWNVSCVDNSYNANTGYSETWRFVVNITPGEEAFLNSCAGYCGYIGNYSGGDCVQNCGGACEGTCEPGGKEWCTIGPPTPECCCYD